MGSTSETYENGTNVVVYVANENARIRSQQQQQQQRQQHRYHSQDIVSAHLHTTSDDHESVFNVCPEYGPSSITVSSYETETTIVAEKHSSSFDISHHNDSDSCAINGDSMRDDTSFASYNGDDSDKLLIDKSSNPCYAGNELNVEPVPVLAPVVAPSFGSENLNESGVANANFAAISDTSYARSESVRSADSVCSSLSSSSAGGNSKVVPPNENFFANASANTSASCATAGGNFDTSQGSVTFPHSYRIVPAPNTEGGPSSFQKPTVSVPYGWKRFLKNGSIIYISPSNSVLTSLEQVNSYLLTDGNCFCGLDCPLYSHTVFNFDPEVVTSPVPASSGGFAKLCNHKRKRIAQNTVPSTGLPNQPYDPQSDSIASRPLIANYCNPGANVKKHVFDISDRRKKRKHVPGQMYISDDTSVPSPIMNDCDISAKENNPSVIPASSQVDVPIYNQQMGMTTGMPEQQLGSTVCLKSSFNPSFPNAQTYYNNNSGGGGSSNHDKNMTNNPGNNNGNSINHHNQDYGFHVPSNDCFVVNANHNRSMANQANVFVAQNEFRVNQNNPNAGYVCNSIENTVSSQTYVDNTNMNQHHHMGCGNIVSQNHPLSASQQPGQMQSLHLPIVAQQLPQQKQQQFQQQHQHQHQRHHAVNQQGNFQPMRVLPNHQHHHVRHQRANNSMNPLDGPKQMVPNADFMTHDKSDNNMYEHACDMNANAQCRVPKNGNSFCNCYHVEKGHMHQPSPQQLVQHAQTQCMSDCGGNCSSVIVQNAQGQQIIMQPKHQMVAYDGTTISMQPKMMHRPPMQQHHPRAHNQMPSSMGQVYPHHAHHQQPPPQNQQQTQTQQMYIMQQQHQQHQQMQMRQNQNQHVSHADDMKATQNQCGSMMHLQMNGGNQSNRGHVNNMMAQRQSVMWQQKHVQHAGINTSHNAAIQCSETTSVSVSPPNPYERVPPLHAHVAPSPPVWNEDSGSRKKFVKNHKTSHTVVTKKMKLSIDGRTGNQTTSNSTAVSSTNTTSSMMKDRNDYANTPVPSFMDDPSGYLAQQTALLQSTISKQTGENPNFKERTLCYSQSSASSTSFSYKTQSRNQPAAQHEENPVTSSTYDRERNVSLSPSDSRSPIQAGTVSTSNQSPVQPGMTSPSTASTNSDTLPQSPAVTRNVRENDSPVAAVESSRVSSVQSAVTTVTSGHTCSSNTITSVLAGKANTAVVATNNSPQNTQPTTTATTTTTTTTRRSPSRSTASEERPGSANTTVLTLSSLPHAESQIATKSPLEMVQSVVSSIQIPHQHQTIEPKTSIPQNSLQTSHFLVSNNGQLLVATSTNPTQSVVSQQSLTKVNSPISMISNSSVVTNVTGTMTQVIPTVGVAQQVLGQQTVLVNTLPSGQLVFQPSMMAVHSAGNTMQIPQLAVATNSVVSSQTLADAAGAISVATSGSFSPRGQAQLLSPETAKRKIAANKKRKISPQQVLQITQSAAHGGVVTSAAAAGVTTAAAATNSVVMQSQAQQNFAQSAPMLQTLILPNKGNQFASTQPLIATANVLQPLNLVHNIPTIQQFIVPAGLGGLGGMVMANGDGTATILPDTVQLNVLTPMQNTAGTVFGHAAGQGILTASPTTGMVIRTQPGGATTATVNQLRSQTISTPGGAQFITTTPTLIVATNNTFSQTSSSYSGSPPDTTTHSPIGNSGQSPDTPSSSIVVGSTDDIASPTSSSSIGSDLQRQPMVYCISSSNVVDWTDTAMEEKKVNIIVEEKKVQCSLIFKEDAV